MKSIGLQSTPAWLRPHLWVGLVVGSFIWIVGALAVAPTAMAQSGANQAGLVVLHGDGRVVTACVAFDKTEISGLALLQRSGLELNIDTGSGMGGTVCRIDSEGCSVPQESCFCRCEGASCSYWSYWRTSAAGWEYSNLGAGSSVVQPGDVEGWMWGQGQAIDAGMPPALTLAEICQATDTATATIPAPLTTQPTETPAATATPVPTASATPLSTNTATATPAAQTLASLPVIDLFRADRMELAAGKTVTLQWRVVNAASVALYAGGQAAAVDAAGATTLAPPYSVEMRLEASNLSGTVSNVLHLSVDAPTQAPTASTSPAFPATPIPQAAIEQAPLQPAPPTAVALGPAAVLPLPAATETLPETGKAAIPQPPLVEQRIQLPLIMRDVGKLPATGSIILPATSVLVFTPTPPLPTTAIAAAELPSIQSATETISPVSSTASPENSQPAISLVGSVWMALGVLFLLPAGISVGVYLLWRLVKMTTRR